MADSYATVLGASRFLITLLRVLNVLLGVALAAAVPASFIFAPVFSDFFTQTEGRIDSSWLLPTLRTWMVLALGMIAATHLLLTRLRAIVDTVREGDPFVPDNAVRLKTIAWCMLTLELLRLTFGFLAGTMNAAGSNIEWEGSLGGFLTGWLAVLLLFVLARVFEKGTQIRADLEAMI